MSDKSGSSRRSVLKQIGVSTVAVGSLSGLATAGDEANHSPEVSGLRSEELTLSQTKRSLKQATSVESGEKMMSFLEDKDYEIEMDSLSGRRLSANEFPEHILVEASLTSSDASRSGSLQLRLYDSEETPTDVGRTVTAEVTIDETAYRSTPLTVGKGGSADLASSDGVLGTPSKEVVEVTELQRRRAFQASMSSEEWPWDCMVSGTYAANGAVCGVLAGITTIAGGILMLIPEPGTTAVGTVAVGTVLTGSCGLAESLEDLLNTDCEINSLGLCVTYPGPFSAPDTYVFPAGDCYAY